MIRAPIGISSRLEDGWLDVFGGFKSEYSDFRLKISSPFACALCPVVVNIVQGATVDTAVCAATMDVENGGWC